MGMVEYEIIVKTRHNWRDGFYEVSADRYSVPEEFFNGFDKLLIGLWHVGEVIKTEFSWVGEDK